MYVLPSFQKNVKMVLNPNIFLQKAMFRFTPRIFRRGHVTIANLVNPSIPKMEVLDACFQNCIKENVSQQYIFKTF